MQLADYLRLPYTIALKPDDEGDWVARVEELEGCVAHGATEAEALERLKEAKALWIETALAHGDPIPPPGTTDSLPSGRWLQRVPRSVHKRLTQIAKREGTSLNQLVTAILSAYIGGAEFSGQRVVREVVVYHQTHVTTGARQITGLRGLRLEGEPNTPTACVKERFV